MKKRNLRPQQAAPVARETTATTNQQGQVTPQGAGKEIEQRYWGLPFAGDDAE